MAGRWSKVSLKLNREAKGKSISGPVGTLASPRLPPQIQFSHWPSPARLTANLIPVGHWPTGARKSAGAVNQGASS